MIRGKKILYRSDKRGRNVSLEYYPTHLSHNNSNASLSYRIPLTVAGGARKSCTKHTCRKGLL